jgi:hypothetical protein
MRRRSSRRSSGNSDPEPGGPHGRAVVSRRAVDGSTPLFYAAEADRAAVVRLLIDRGADPDIPGRKGIRALAAAYEGSAGSVKLM